MAVPLALKLQQYYQCQLLPLEEVFLDNDCQWTLPFDEFAPSMLNKLWERLKSDLKTEMGKGNNASPKGKLQLCTVRSTSGVVCVTRLWRRKTEFWKE